MKALSVLDYLAYTHTHTHTHIHRHIHTSVSAAAAKATCANSKQVCVCYLRELQRSNSRRMICVCTDGVHPGREGRIGL